MKKVKEECVIDLYEKINEGLTKLLISESIIPNKKFLKRVSYTIISFIDKEIKCFKNV